MSVASVTARELAGWLADPGRTQPLLLDVREPWEVAIVALPDARPMPMNEVPRRLAEVDLERPIVCVCHHGARSLQVAAFLQARGAADVRNLTGGVAAWTRDVDPTLPTY